MEVTGPHLEFFSRTDIEMSGDSCIHRKVLELPAGSDTGIEFFMFMVATDGAQDAMEITIDLLTDPDSSLQHGGGSRQVLPVQLGTGAPHRSPDVLLQYRWFVEGGEFPVVNRAELAEVEVETPRLDGDVGGDPVVRHHERFFQFDLLLVEEDDSRELVSILDLSEQAQFRSSQLEAIGTRFGARSITPTHHEVSEKAHRRVEGVATVGRSIDTMRPGVGIPRRQGMGRCNGGYQQRTRNKETEEERTAHRNSNRLLDRFQEMKGMQFLRPRKSPGSIRMNHRNG